MTAFPGRAYLSLCTGTPRCPVSLFLTPRAGLLYIFMELRPSVGITIPSAVQGFDEHH